MQKILDELFWNLLVTLIGLHPMSAFSLLVLIGAIIVCIKWDKWSSFQRWAWSVGIIGFVTISVYLLHLQALKLPPPIRITKTVAPPYVVGHPAAVNIYYYNDGATTIELSGYSKVFVTFDVPADDKKVRELEEEWWKGLMKDVRREQGFGVPSRTEMFSTLEGRALTEGQVTKLRGGSAALYFMGTFWYSDEDGTPWKTEICGSYMHDIRVQFLCQHHNVTSRGN